MSLFDSLIAGSRRPRPVVRPGALFSAPPDGVRREVARVIGVRRDPMGIDHVTFELTIERRPHLRLETRRTLNLASFLACYPNALDPLPTARLPLVAAE